MVLKYLLFFIVIILVLFFCVERFCRSMDKTLLQVLHPEWFTETSEFPEEKFPPKKNSTLYAERVDKGYKVMKEKKVVIAGLCINIEKKIPKITRRLNNLKKYFKDVEIVTFENDSKDNTRELLKKAGITLVPCPEDKDCKLKKTNAVSHGIISDKRMRMMADYRNRLLNYIRTNFSHFDCVIFIDLDIQGPISIDGLAHSFSQYDRWDAVSGYGLSGITLSLGIPVYYDILAYDDGTFKGHTHCFLNALPITLKTMSKKRGDDIFPIKSGFCGLELVKMNVINDPTVTYEPKDGKYICEHVIFHNNMRDKHFSNIFIDPNLLLLVGVQGDTKNNLFY